jgi:hypothetical protein
VRLETFSRVLAAMCPSVDRITAEADLVHQMRVYREKGHQEAVEYLLDAAGGFFGRFSHYALDARMEDVYRQLRRAWYEVCVAYEEGDEEIVDKAFKLYTIACTHRLVVS